MSAKKIDDFRLNYEHEISSLSSNFGLSLNNIDLSSLEGEMIDYFKNLLYTHKVLLIKNINFSPREFLNFAKKLGEPVQFVDEEYRHPEYPEIFVVSNVKRNGKKFGMDRVGYYWHSDSSFNREPLAITMLHSQLVPNQGGETAFINMVDVYSMLKPLLPKNASTMHASHEGKWRYLITESDIGLAVDEILERDEKFVPSQIHPLIITHPYARTKSLYLSQGITRRIIELNENESKNLLSNIWHEIEARGLKYTHAWRQNELLIWDNRSVIHRAYPTPAGQERLMFRVGVNDGQFYYRE